MGSVKVKNWQQWIYLVSLLLHICAAYFSVGYYHWDEHFQILEFATIKLPFSSGQPGDLAWEYGAQIRPAMQPLMAVQVAKVLNYLNFYTPFRCVLILQLFSAVLGWASLILFSKEAFQKFKLKSSTALMLFLSLLIWFFPYLHARFSSESLSGSLFFIALYLFLRHRSPASNVLRSYLSLSLIGLLFGLAFYVRFQTAIMLLGMGFWLLFIEKSSWSSISMLISGFVIAILMGIVSDWWFYGEWLFTPWNYFEANIINDVASEFGVSPWWTYFYWLIKYFLPPFSIFILLAIIYAFWKHPSNLLTWILVPFVIIHMIIGHKELRFLFLVINAVPVLLALAYDNFTYKPSLKWVVRSLAALILLVNSFLLTKAFMPINSNTELYKFVWEKYNTVNNEDQVLCVYNNNPYASGFLAINFYKPKNIFLLSNEHYKDTSADYPGVKKTIFIFYNLNKEEFKSFANSELVFSKNNWEVYELKEK